MTPPPPLLPQSKLAFQKGYKRLGKALADGRSTDLRKGALLTCCFALVAPADNRVHIPSPDPTFRSPTEDMLILASIWGLRSNIWRRRGPQVSADGSDDDTSPLPDGRASLRRVPSGEASPGPGGTLHPLERTAVGCGAEQSQLLVALQQNTLPRLVSIGEAVVLVHLSARPLLSPPLPPLLQSHLTPSRPATPRRGVNREC